jgi:hypothetical protein
VVAHRQSQALHVLVHVLRSILDWCA